jgi:hypothetical protein
MQRALIGLILGLFLCWGAAAEAPADPFELPAWEGETSAALAEAVIDYSSGKIAAAIKKATDLDDGEAFLAFLQQVGDDRLKAAGDAFSAGQYFLALEIWQLTQKQFGTSHPVGKEAKARATELKRDKSLKDRIAAQELLAKADDAATRGKKSTVKSSLKKILTRYEETPEYTVALDRMKSVDPELAIELTSGGFPFGTVTPTAMIPGDMDTKGDCRRLQAGGYMKFDLSSYPDGHQIRSATLKLHVQKWSGNTWRWITLLDNDPLASDPKTIFNETQAHKQVCSHVITHRGSEAQWITVQLNEKAIARINARLKESGKDRWVAMAFAFE